MDADPGHPDWLPPGQRAQPELAVKHYGPLPRRDDAAWVVSVTGATAGGARLDLTLEHLQALPQVTRISNLHCTAGWSTPAVTCSGVPAATVLGLLPPAPGVTHVLVHAEYGYTATVRVGDLSREGVLLATRLAGEPLPKAHGGPVRLLVPHLYAYKSVKWLRGLEYCVGPKRGFWENRGYHLNGDPWAEERYSHQE